MDVRIFTEPQQGASYDDLLRVAQEAERLGFTGFFRSDHYLHMGGHGAPGPTDAWTTLAGLARDTSTIRLGTLVSSATFRLPGPLAVQVAGVDQMSGGRVELGLGAGWFEEEHTAFGIPFPGVRERFDRLEEQLAIITGLWATPDGQSFTHRGAHYELEECPVLTRPTQERLPVIVGGTGPGARRPWPRGTPRSTTSRSSRRSRSTPRSAGSARRAQRSAATRRSSSTRPLRWSASATTRRP